MRSKVEPLQLQVKISQEAADHKRSAHPVNKGTAPADQLFFSGLCALFKKGPKTPLETCPAAELASFAEIPVLAKNIRVLYRGMHSAASHTFLKVL